MKGVRRSTVVSLKRRARDYGTRQAIVLSHDGPHMTVIDVPLADRPISILDACEVVAAGCAVMAQSNIALAWECDLSGYLPESHMIRLTAQGVTVDGTLVLGYRAQVLQSRSWFEADLSNLLRPLDQSLPMYDCAIAG